MAEEVVTTTAEAPEDYKEYLKWQASEKTAPAIQRDEKGKFVSTQPKAQESVPADAPEKTVEPEAKAETAPESGTEEEPQELEESVGKEAQKRIRQLLARVKELESKSDVKAESSPAADVKRQNRHLPSRDLPDRNGQHGIKAQKSLTKHSPHTKNS
jgi:hypothetical protein